MSTHLLVANPTAQSGRNAPRIQKALELLSVRGVDCELFPTLPGGRTIPALLERLDRSSHRCVISMGGDGTFREVASAIYGSHRRELIAMGPGPAKDVSVSGRALSAIRGRP